MFSRVFKTGIQANYQISANPSFHSDLWAVYPAKQKSSGKQVSVFIFDKKKFESSLVKNNIVKKNDKKVVNEAYEVLRNQVSNIAKFRHPNVLTLIEPLEEHKSNFIFVTEHLVSCLNTLPQDLDDLNIQKGVLQILKALQFVHVNAHSIHLSIQPSSIFVSENLDWKLAGFGHIQPNDATEFFIPQYDPRIPNFINLNLNYTAPEVVFENRIEPSSDVFSLGCLIYYLYNDQELLLNCNNSINYYKEDFVKFERILKQNNISQVFKKIPDSLNGLMPNLLSRYPNQRPTIDEFFNSSYFNNPLIKTMIFFDELPTKNDDELKIFLKSLPNLLPLFPNSIPQKKFLPILINLLNNKTESLTSITLTIILLIGQTLSQLSFNDKIFPIISNSYIMESQESEIVLLEKLKILQNKIKAEEFKKFLLKLIEKTLTVSNNFQVQIKCLENCDVIIESIDFPTIKNVVFPKICEIFSKTTSLTVKVKTTQAFVILIEKKGIDKFTINETLLPLLKSMKTRDSKILLSVLKIYDISARLLDEEEIINSIIPQLWVLSIAKTLSSAQYTEFTNIINSMSSSIQKKHLERLKNLEDTKPDENEDDKEKFRHLLYGKEDDGAFPETPRLNNPLTPTLRTAPVQRTAPTTASLTPKKFEPLTLNKPKSNLSDFSFGSKFQGEVPKTVSDLRNSPHVSNDINDDFEDFVSAPTVSSPVNPQPQVSTPLAVSSTIDWSTESNKVQTNLNSINGFQPLQPNRSGLPPGLSQPLQPSKRSNDISLI